MSDIDKAKEFFNGKRETEESRQREGIKRKDRNKKGNKKAKPNIKLGLTLRALREYSNLSEEEAASISGVAASKIEKFEKGVYTPTKTQLMKILSSYGSLNLNEIHAKKRLAESLEYDAETPPDRPRPLEDLVKESGHVWQVFSDGSAIPNPGKGAWAYVIVCDGKDVEHKSGFSSWATNNEMELTGMLKGLERLTELGIDTIEAVCDSQYVVLGITDWVDLWLEEDPTLNYRPYGKLWKHLVEIRDSLLSLSVNWVRGHSGQEWNELCDSLCENEYYMRGLPEQSFYKGRFRKA